MEYSVAARVKGILVSAGHTDEKRAVDLFLPSRDEREAAQQAYEDLGRIGAVSYRVSTGDYFTSTPDGEGALVVYHGSVYRETERLRLYRLAIENCSFWVTEESDPDRPGRMRLRVVKP